MLALARTERKSRSPNRASSLIKGCSNQRALDRDVTTGPRDALFGSCRQKCVERTRDKTPGNKPSSIVKAIRCERYAHIAPRSGKFLFDCRIAQPNQPIVPAPPPGVWLMRLPGTILMFPVNHDFSQYLDPAHPTRRCCRYCRCIASARDNNVFLQLTRFQSRATDTTFRTFSATPAVGIRKATPRA
jgi:hypothetical protein